MNVDVVIEYNDNGTILWVEQLLGAFVRAKTPDEALKKLPREVSAYTKWASGRSVCLDEVHINAEIKSTLRVEDADSDTLFPSERLPMTMAEYTLLKELAIRSAKDFKALYLSVPQRGRSLVKSRQTFYGKIPTSATEMLSHTNDTLAYYASGIGIEHPNLLDAVDNRLSLFKHIETNPNFLLPRVYTAPDGELWTLKKVLRRLIWHDRIHAKALYRKAISFWGRDRIVDPFGFSELV